jgi:hypothetical protein
VNVESLQIINKNLFQIKKQTRSHNRWLIRMCKSKILPVWGRSGIICRVLTRGSNPLPSSNMDGSKEYLRNRMICVLRIGMCKLVKTVSPLARASDGNRVLNEVDIIRTRCTYSGWIKRGSTPLPSYSIGKYYSSYRLTHCYRRRQYLL